MSFDLALQMQGSGGVSNALIELLGAKHNAGFYLPGQHCPDPERFLEYPLHEPEVWRHLRLMEHLGIDLQGSDLEFPLYADDWDEYRRLQQEVGLGVGRLAVLHPGARAQERRWPLERFAQVGDGLAERGLQVVLTGTPVEAPLARQVASLMRRPALNLAGKTNLGALGCLVSEAELVVSNDTGISHVAAALRTPSVVLFSASDANRWAPLDLRLHRVLAWASSVGAEAVLNQADGLLQAERSYAD